MRFICADASGYAMSYFYAIGNRRYELWRELVFTGPSGYDPAWLSPLGEDAGWYGWNSTEGMNLEMTAEEWDALLPDAQLRHLAGNGLTEEAPT